MKKAPMSVTCRYFLRPTLDIHSSNGDVLASPLHHYWVMTRLLISIFSLCTFQYSFGFEETAPSTWQRLTSSSARHYSQVRWTDDIKAHWPSLKYYLDSSPRFKMQFDRASEVTVANHCALVKKFTQKVFAISPSDFVATVQQERSYNNVIHSTNLNPLDYSLSRESVANPGQPVEMLELRLVDDTGRETTFYKKTGLPTEVPISIDDIIEKSLRAMQATQGARRVLFAHTHPYEALIAISSVSTSENLIKSTPLSESDIDIADEIRRRAPQLDFHMMAIVGAKPELLCRLTYPSN